MMRKNWALSQEMLSISFEHHPSHAHNRPETPPRSHRPDTAALQEQDEFEFLLAGVDVDLIRATSTESSNKPWP